MSKSIIHCQNLCKIYHDGHEDIQVLKRIDLKINLGDRVAIVGPSGSGKSTLLHLLGGIDTPTSGQVFAHHEDWQTLSERKRCKFRNRYFGFIYQFHHLLPEFSALENVALPLLLANQAMSVAKEKATETLNEVGLAHRLTHKPSQLSGGERQRVAIARALVHEPDCVFADEPTGNLDQSTAEHVFELMLRLNARLKTALVIVTHDMRLAEKMDKILVLKDGNIVSSSEPRT